MKRLLLAAAALAGFGMIQVASAANPATASMGVSGTVVTVCTVTAVPVAFGNVAVSGTTAGTGTVKVTCTDGGTYTVALDDGVNAVAGQRTLINGTNALKYELYSDSGTSQRWGHTVGTDLISGIGNGSEQDLPVYGLIASGQTLVSGPGSLAYADTITVSVAY